MMGKRRWTKKEENRERGANVETLMKMKKKKEKRYETTD